MIFNIHSKYSIHELFSFLSEKRKFKLSKYNLFLNNKLDLSILDYKTYTFLKKIENYNFPYSNNYIIQLKKDYNDMFTNDEELNKVIINCLLKKENFNISFSDINFDSFIKNNLIENNININTEDLIKENIPRLLLIKNDKLTEKAIKTFENIFNSFSINKKMDKISLSKFMSETLNIKVNENDENVNNLLFEYDIDDDGYLLFSDFYQFYYDSIKEDVNLVWNDLYALGYNDSLEKNEVDINDILNNLNDYEENNLFNNLLKISQEKIFKLSLLFKIDKVFIKYFNEKQIFKNLKKIDISISNLHKIIKLNIVFWNVEELYLNVEKHFKYNQDELNNIFPNIISLIIYVEENFDLINLIKIIQNSKIENLRILIFNYNNNINSNIKSPIILDKIKMLEIKIDKGCEIFGFDFLFKIFNYIKFPSLKEYILDFDLYQFINYFKNKIFKFKQENDFDHINQFIIDTSFNKKVFILKNFFSLPNKLSLIRYFNLKLKIFSYAYKKKKEQKYYFKFNLGCNNELIQYYSNFDLSFDYNEIIKYKKIEIKGINKLYQKINHHNEEIIIEKIIEKEDIHLCDIHLNINQKQYFIKSFKDLRSIYCENEINNENLKYIYYIFEENNLKNLKYINLTLSNLNEYSIERNNIYNILSKFIQNLTNLKSIILRLNPYNFNKNVYFFLEFIQNLKKLKVINISQNIENPKYDISLEKIFSKFPKIKEKIYYFDEIKIGNEGFTNNKNNILNFNYKCTFEINSNLLGKEIKLLDDNISKNSLIYLNNKKINKSQYEFFKEGKYILKIIFKKLNMSYMFYNCFSLTYLSLSNFNTYNITNMNAMFSHCSSLISLNLSNFNTNNVIFMNSMFSHCSSLISLNLTNFNTNNVIDMSNMFCKYFSLISLNLSNFNTYNVKNMKNMFYKCYSLTYLDLSNFDTYNVNDMSNIFSKLNYNCNIQTKDEKLLKIIK